MEDNSRLEIREKEIEREIEELNKKVSRFTTWSWVFVGLGFVVLFIGFVLFANDEFKGFHEFGDFIGGSVGSIWSLAGLFFVYVAFLGQKQSILNQQIEISYNQEELRATRKELAGQKEQMELQNATLKQQQFENTFFHLFKYHQDLLQNMAIKEKELYGIRLIQELYLNISRLGHKESTEIAIVNELNIRMKHHYYTSFIIPIVKSILQQLLLVDKKCSDDKDYYIQLIKSTLSNESIAFATYFSFLPEYSELKRLIIKYEFLNDFPTEKFKKDVQLLKEIGLIP